MTGPNGYRYKDGRLRKADPYLNEGEIGYLPIVSDQGRSNVVIRVRHNGAPCFEFVGVMGGVDAFNFVSENNVNSSDFYIALECLAPMMIKFKQKSYGDDETLAQFYSWDLNKNV